MRRMGRPQKCRFIEAPPEYTGFKPRGMRAESLEKVYLSIDEYECIRLTDYKGLPHEECAGLMGISRPVFTRLVESARRKIAEAIIEGKELMIEGGNVVYGRKHSRCPKCSGGRMNGNVPPNCDNCIDKGSLE